MLLLIVSGVIETKMGVPELQDLPRSSGPLPSEMPVHCKCLGALCGFRGGGMSRWGEAGTGWH